MASVQTLDTQHEDMIHDAQLDYYGRRLATCSSDRSIKIFEVNESSTNQIAEIKGHEGPVWEVSWAHPKFGSILASCSYDRRVCIWREGPTNTWTKIYEYDKHESSVNSIAWAPHEFGLSLACASSDGTISIISHKGDNNWQVQLILRAHSIGVNSVSWAPAMIPGSLLNPSTTSAPIKRLASGGCDNLVKIWRFSEVENDWKEEESLEQHIDWVRDVSWAPNIGLPTTTIASCSQDGTVVIWTQDTPSSTWNKKVLPKFPDIVWRVSWSITGNILSVSGDSKVTLWKETLESEWQCISGLPSERDKESEMK